MMIVCRFLLALVLPLWPEGRIPDYSPHQTALPRQEMEKSGFDPAVHRMPYLEWCEPPTWTNGACAILLSGGSYNVTGDRPYMKSLERVLRDAGVTCVWLWYRAPRPKGLPIYQSAWEDGQRAVRLVRSRAAAMGLDPERIGAVGCSAGAHLSLLLGTSSQTPAYAKVDDFDEISCHINWSIPMCPAYVLTDGLDGPNKCQGDAPDITVDSIFNFDEKTCPMCFFHGGADKYSPLGSTRFYRRLHEMKIPSELHLDPSRGHGAVTGKAFAQGVEFLRQLRILGPVDGEVAIMDRYSTDSSRARREYQEVWPAGLIPDVRTNQCLAYLEWHIPKKLTTRSIQIIYSGGSYFGNGVGGAEVAPVRRFLNEKGMTVVTLRYRTPRPGGGLGKHVSAWQDLQRTIRIVRAQAPERGLDPEDVGIMGSSAGGHLALLGATSSLHNSYLPRDEIDRIPCNVKWAIAVYPAYLLVDEERECLAPELAFDANSCPVLFLHGDADEYTSLNSVVCWEQLRRKGIQCELHILAMCSHGFTAKSIPGTGSHTWLERVWEFIQRSEKK